MYTHTHTHARACARTYGCTHMHSHLHVHYYTYHSYINSPECDRSNQAYEMASHVLCDCKALDFMQLGDLEETCVIRYCTLFKKIRYDQGA